MNGQAECDEEWLARCLGDGRLAPLILDDATALAGELEETDYAGGTCIFREGEVVDRVHILRHGAVGLRRAFGQRRAAFQLLHPGDVFGDVPAFLSMPAPFDACAIEDSCALAIRVPALLGLIGRRPGLAQRWLVSLAGRMEGLQERIGELLTGSLDAQIASFLLHADGDGAVTITQATLAELLGAQRTSVNQALKRLAAQGLVAHEYRYIEVLDHAALAALVPTNG